jgi:DNA-binding MarR family transcriptional regulator
LLTRLTHQLGQELAAEYATHDITAQPLDASLFILVAGGDARLTELAAQLNTSKQALLAIVDRLERDGCLVRVAGPEDWRAKRIHLTQTALKSRVGAGDWARLRATLADLAGPRDP